MAKYYFLSIKIGNGTYRYSARTKAGLNALLKAAKTLKLTNVRTFEVPR